MKPEKDRLADLKHAFLHINEMEGDIDFNDGKTWFKAHRSKSTGIGKTFEDLLNKPEDNYQLPDYEGIELKAHDTGSDSMITLFTKAPNLPRSANTVIRQNYGYDEDGSGIKTLHSTIYSNRKTFNAKSDHYFQIINNRDNQTVDLVVFDHDKNEIKDEARAKWSYETLKKAIKNKIPVLAIVLTDVKKAKKTRYFHYKEIVYVHFKLETLLKAIDNGDLAVDLRLGAYKSGKKKGQTHDHGTGFRISFTNMRKYTPFTSLVKL